ncbi:MAG: tRNA (adenosine(37)-N6)-threonylcarbamoyltransferase complex dimerization subunit type 1 TsaB [Saprospiraceae bacterium]
MILLLLETSAAFCTVAICDDSSILSSVIADKPNSHTEDITLLIQKACDSARVPLSLINGIAISHGPGSYTSLRVGVATAKAICYALNIPLISIESDRILMNGVHNTDVGKNDIILTMIDARRMEVYYSVWDSQGELLQPIHSMIIENAVTIGHEIKKIHLCGSGAKKYYDAIADDRHILHHHHPLAEHMAKFARKNFISENFENLVTYSPFYFKEPNITLSTKKII